MGQFALIAASAALTASQQIQQTGAQEVEMVLAQREESSDARERELDRKRRINAVLGEQAATAAAKGLQMTGSVANISIEDARRATMESRIDGSTTRSKINALGQRKRTIRRVGNIRAGATIFKSASRFAARG